MFQINCFDSEGSLLFSIGMVSLKIKGIFKWRNSNINTPTKLVMLFRIYVRSSIVLKNALTHGHRYLSPIHGMYPAA